MATGQSRKTCIYCGGEARKVKKGEHIVPDALGGKKTISEFCKGRTVCNPCNNGKLSQLDRELCSRSHLSVVAAQELDTFVWQSWDVDHSANNLLLEAKPDFTGSSMTLFPQMIFEQGGPQLRGDHEELQKFGSDRFQKVFVRFLLEAFHAYKNGKQNRLNPKRIQANETIKNRYRYPPRIFARRRIADFASGMSFELQYLYASDKRFALSQLESWDSSKPFRRFEKGIGSELPALRCSYEVGAVLRALTKMAVNLLAALCPNTPVDRDGFTGVMQIVLGEIPLHPALMGINGFVYASDVEKIKADKSAHSFRLLHMDGKWHVFSSFFGGRIGSFVRFPGPNGESWCCADVVAPLKSKDWTVTTSSVLQPLPVRIEWQDPAKIMPSVEMLNVKSEMRVLSVPANKAKTKGQGPK